jgi:hypothetical protein
MFSYYGTKARLADKYPVPKHDTIIEPFAGAAGYSCLHHDRQVRLFDANPKIIAVWNWLIAASPADVQRLPDIQPGESVHQYGSLTDAERWLIGFCINPASTMPKITASQRSAWASYKRRITDMVPKVKHWTAACQSFDAIPNQTATWYVDPPYQKAGKYYFGFAGIRFDQLGQWCRGRQGQVIVCENRGADWLPFVPFLQQKGMSKTQTEAIWLESGLLEVEFAYVMS